MPYLRIETNLELSREQAGALLKEGSARLGEALGKPERYVMVQVVGGADLMFAGTEEPAAYVELKSIGLSETQTQTLSRLVCGFLEAQLDLPPDRVYIEFIAIPGKFWGWNSSTF